MWNFLIFFQNCKNSRCLGAGTSTPCSLDLKQGPWYLFWHKFSPLWSYKQPRRMPSTILLSGANDRATLLRLTLGLMLFVVCYVFVVCDGYPSKTIFLTFKIKTAPVKRINITSYWKRMCIYRAYSGSLALHRWDNAHYHSILHTFNTSHISMHSISPENKNWMAPTKKRRRLFQTHSYP